MIILFFQIGKTKKAIHSLKDKFKVIANKLNKEIVVEMFAMNHLGNSLSECSPGTSSFAKSQLFKARIVDCNLIRLEEYFKSLLI